MNTMKIFQVLILALFVSISVRGQEKLKKTAQGLEYQIFTDNSGDKIKLNDIITFNFIQKTDGDSVLMSSYAIGRPVKIQIQPSKNIADLMDFFPLLTAKDSALVKVPSDSIFKDAEANRPPFFPKGSSLVFLIKVEKVQSLDEVMAEEKEEMAKLQAEEKISVDKYIADKKLTLKETTSGLKYIITKASTKGKPNSGDTVYVNYTGRTIDGKVFDSSIEAEAKKAGLDQPGRTYEPISFAVGQGEVIRGWDEGLLLLNEGAKAKFIIPSTLAYGPQGAGNDIKPFSSLIFDVELVRVKPAKQVAAPKTPTKAAPKAPAKKPVKAPVKKAPVKKTGTTTKKPVS
jgi:FKBP-type peptidyl-prolyl cis-trans isomerase FkpA